MPFMEVVFLSTQTVYSSPIITKKGKKMQCLFLILFNVFCEDKDTQVTFNIFNLTTYYYIIMFINKHVVL